MNDHSGDFSCYAAKRAPQLQTFAASPVAAVAQVRKVPETVNPRKLKFYTCYEWQQCGLQLQYRDQLLEVSFGPEAAPFPHNDLTLIIGCGFANQLRN